VLTRAGVWAMAKLSEEQERTIALFILLLACLILPAGFFIQYLTIIFQHQPLFPDFFALWSFGRFTFSHAPATIYDERLMHAFQVGLGMPSKTVFPFLYPPSMLLALAPFGALPYALALPAWLILTFGLYLCALAPWRWPRSLFGLLLAAPSTAVCILIGQNGFLTAALMIGGLRLLDRRPVVSGLLFGLLTAKPQLALLMPVVLVFGGRWRALLAMIAASLGLILLSAVVFGPSAWLAFLSFHFGKAAVLTGGRTELLRMMPTITSAVIKLGGHAPLPVLCQVLAALLALLCVWRVRGRTDVRALAIATLATFTATPFAFNYDLTALTGAALLVLAQPAPRGGRYDRAEFFLLAGCIITQTLLDTTKAIGAEAVPILHAAALVYLTFFAAGSRQCREGEGGSSSARLATASASS
jgi:Glycosyltransferase family 87